MSWATSAGVRVLRGPEKELFLFGAFCLYDTILLYTDLKEDDENEPVSVDYCSEVFNKMPDEEKIVNLAYVVKELVDETEPKELYAWSEAIVHAVFCILKQTVNDEIELYDPKTNKPQYATWKNKSLRHWLNKCNIKYLDKEVEITGIKDTNNEAWEEVIECMQERILWDDDFNMEFIYFEASQEGRIAVNQALGIEPNYFVSVGLPASEDNVRRANVYFETLENLS